jgi:hypothetical protein
MAQLIDRDHERTLFGEILSEADAARLMTICVPRKLGKSSLLECFEYESQDFGLPVARVVISELDDRSPFGFSEQLVGLLTEHAFDFPTYDYFIGARADEDFSVFRRTLPSGQGEVRAGGATISSSVVANQLRDVYQGDNQTIQQAPKKWTDQQEQMARERCALAFLEDLRTVTEQDRVLLLVDAYEDCPPTLARWLERRLLAKHVLADPPTGLTVIVAGRTGPELPPANAQPVRALTSLSKWTDAHIQTFLERRGISTEQLYVDMVRNGLHELDWSFEQLESWVALIKPQEP